MTVLYDALRFMHLISFVFMSIPLFNLIVVNERAVMGGKFVYATDRYMENIIRRGAARCFVFQTSVMITGVGLLLTNSMGLEALWENWIVLVKTLLLFAVMGLLSYVHFVLQPKIEAKMAEVGPDKPAPDDFGAQLKAPRVLRKRLATFCLFILITIIILGVQVHEAFNPFLTAGLIVGAALFAWRANKTLVRFGWL